jgi:hypothetical protein
MCITADLCKLALQLYALMHLNALLYYTHLQETAELLARHLCCAPTAANTTTTTAGTAISATYGDFASFITDPHYSELQTRVHAQLAQQLVALGSTHFKLSAAFSSAWTLSQRTFLAGLAALGLQLGARDAQRLLVRFALPPGSEPDSANGSLLADRHVSAAVVTPWQRCDAQRFVATAAASQQWRTALQHASAATAAAREAESELREQRSPKAVPTAVSTVANGLSPELVRMAQCLGMRVHTDADLLWIAEAALNAPLPDGWELRTTAATAADATGNIGATGSSSEARRYSACLLTLMN